MGTERTVHEALEHAGVQHRVRGGMLLALRVQLIDRIVEGKPLTHAGGQLAVFFNFFQNVKVIPVAGVVLNGGDAPVRGFGQGAIPWPRGAGREWAQELHR